MWLERFERFTQFLMLVSEGWKTTNVATVYNVYQKRLAEVITFAIAFLFNEIHAKKRASPMNGQSVQLNLGGQSSPQDQMMLNKLYAQTLKNVLLFLGTLVQSTSSETPTAC